MTRLSVLDLSPVPSGSTASEAVANTLDLARHAEALGFARYWLAEHHNAAALASSSPEILIGAVAAGAEQFPEQLEELMSYVSRDPDPSARFGPLKAVHEHAERKRAYERLSFAFG